MGKKHKHPEHENLERWLVSYADFITLLFATFVVLYATAQSDLSKLKDVSASIKQAFNPAKSIMDNSGGVMKGTPESSILPSSGNSILDKINPKTVENAQAKGTAEPLAEAVESINSELRKESAGPIHGVDLKIQNRGVILSFSSELLFSPGSAGLKPEAFGALHKVSDELKKAGRTIHVEGHTDSLPIASAIYPSNWELSTARSSSVVRFLVTREGLNPDKMAAVGYGSNRPIATNENDKGRAKNRRVDIVVLSAVASASADAGSSTQNEGTVISAEAEPSHIPVRPNPKPAVEKPVPQEPARVLPANVAPIKPNLAPPKMNRPLDDSKKNNTPSNRPTSPRLGKSSVMEADELFKSKARSRAEESGN